MKKFLSPLIIIFGIILLVFPLYIHITSQEAFASETKEQALEIIPQSNQSINVANMAPGDTHGSEFILKNRTSTPLEVSFNHKKLSWEGKADLYHQLVLTLHYDGKEVYRGKMKDFKAIELGSIPGNGEKEVQITQHLPGPETGDEFEKARLETQFIFSVKGGITGLPQTGGIGPVVFWGIGGLMTIAGLSLIKRK